MRVLLVHNQYQQSGGEDTIMEMEGQLLRQADHKVIEYLRSNVEIDSLSLWQKIGLPKRMIWASDTVRELHDLIERHKPDIAHFHNTFLMISPAAYYVCRELGVPVVQSLHNPRLMCPAASLYRRGRVCEDCLGKAIPWPGIVHACYRNSRSQTAAVAAMLASHRMFGTWQRLVDTYIVFTEFYRRKFIEAGLPPERIKVKPHFVDDDPGPINEMLGGYALFIGRLDPAKGVRTLMQAWKLVNSFPLKIRGDGHLLEEVRAVISQEEMDSVELVERLPRNELFDLIKGAKFLVWPSEGYYETFGLVAIEAFACRVPVLASRVGVMAEIVEDGVTGLHFTPGDAEDLAAKVRWAVEHPDEMRVMGSNARRVYEKKYTPEINYRQLMAIYQEAMAENRLETDQTSISPA